MNHNIAIPIEVEFTVGFKSCGEWVAEKGERFLAVPMEQSYHGKIIWTITIRDFQYCIYYQQGASNRPGRFRLSDYKKGYAKLAENSPINKMAELLYCF